MYNRQMGFKKLCGLAFLAMAGCGGTNSNQATNNADLPGPSRLRFFNATSQSDLGLSFQGVRLNATDGSGADRGKGLQYENVPDGTGPLIARKNGGRGADFVSLNDATLETTDLRGVYSAFSYGTQSSGGVLLLSDLISTDAFRTELILRIVNLIQSNDVLFYVIRRNGHPVAYLNSSKPGSDGFFTIGGKSYLDNSIDFSIQPTRDQNGTEPIAKRFPFKINTTQATTVVIYGQANSPSYAVLKSNYANSSES